MNIESGKAFKIDNKVDLQSFPDDKVPQSIIDAIQWVRTEAEKKDKWSIFAGKKENLVKPRPNAALAEQVSMAFADALKEKYLADSSADKKSSHEYAAVLSQAIPRYLEKSGIYDSPVFKEFGHAKEAVEAALKQTLEYYLKGDFSKNWKGEAGKGIDRKLPPNVL